MSLFNQLREEFLHYVWRSRHYDFINLQTLDGRKVQVITPGTWNQDAGPDFLEARIRLDGMEWAGHVELHLRSSDWYKHGHHKDPNYNGTILHVVLNPGQQEILLEDGSIIPELAIASRIPSDLSRRYNHLLASEQSIACAALLKQNWPDQLPFWLNRMALERMIAKAYRMRHNLKANKQDWEQILWEEIAAMMGGPVNKNAFRALAQRLPFSLIQKYRSDRLALESLLFGQATMLPAIGQCEVGSYPFRLRQEWDYLRKKHQLSQNPEAIRFLRMRPAAFPTIRMSQLAGLIYHFDPIMHLLDLESIGTFLKTRIEVSEYWQSHYRFGEKRPVRSKRLGKDQKEKIISNVFLPLTYLYQQAHGRQEAAEIFEQGLYQIPAEENRHTRPLTALGFPNQHAFHSQGLIQLKTQYCIEKKCLQCGIGYQLLSGKRSAANQPNR